MKLTSITRQSLRFYWKTHVVTMLAIGVAAAVLAGALAVDDSVKATLTRRMQMSVGQVVSAVQCPGLFRAQLADDLKEKLTLQRRSSADAAQIIVVPVLRMTGFADNADGTMRAGDVQVLGVDERFWKLGPKAENVPLEKDAVIVGRELADRLGLKIAQEIVVRMRAAGGTPAEAILTPEEQTRVSFRRTVVRIVEDEQFGGFDLNFRSGGGLNIFMPLDELNAIAKTDSPTLWVNMLLAGGMTTANDVRQTLPMAWQLEDAGLELHIVDWPRMLELRSRDVFIGDAIAQAIQNKVGGALGVVTYFVNELSCKGQTVPYSFVCAVDDMPQEKSPMTVTQGDIMINEWLADALNASEGDKIEMRYFVPSQGKKLNEETATFTVKTVIPMIGHGADKSLMPNFKMLSEAENCRDWNAGIPIDFSKITDADEAYWKKYKGAPKAFISMKAAKVLWASRFGTLTAIRFSVYDYGISALRAKILSAIEPWQAGFVVSDIRHAARRSSNATTDFGGLTIGLSMFLIASALILAALVWSFGLQRRTGQVGMLSAAGFTKGRILWVFLLEEGPMILVASLAGTAAGLGYTILILAGLNSTWAGATGGIETIFAARPQTMALAAGISIVMSAVVWLLRMRDLLNRPTAELLDRTQEVLLPKGRGGIMLALAIFLVAIASGLGIYGTKVSAQMAAELFFSAGAIVLIASALLLSSGLAYLGLRAKQVSSSRIGLAIKTAARRHGRSLVVAMTLAMGVFVVLSTGVFQKPALKDMTNKISGTGGFTLWAQSSIPLVNVPDKATGIRLWSAQDASCLNLARAQQPTLWGVRAAAMAGRFRFKKILDQDAASDPWEQLNAEFAGDVVAAIGDWATVYWGLHKNIGDEIDYTDQSGRVFRLRIVGLLDDSIMQGGLIISERQFLKRFEDVSGWSVFLMDVPTASVEDVGKRLVQSLSAYGFEFETTAQRLSRFHEVENTYIRIFMILGSMGLILGTVGVGLVVLLNAMERAGELAMMRAIGFGKKTLAAMLFVEHAGLLTAGLIFGILSSAVAAGPQLGQIAVLPWKMMVILIAAMWVGGLLWTALAASAAMAGDLLEPLRKE